MAELDSRDSPRVIPRTAPKAIDRAMLDTARQIEATNSAPAVRDLTLDVVKGALVVVMVVYHAMNVFSTAGADEYAYVRFVSGSFILMSGYIVARFDGPRFRA